MIEKFFLEIEKKQTLGPLICEEGSVFNNKKISGLCFVVLCDLKKFFMNRTQI